MKNLSIKGTFKMKVYTDGKLTRTIEKKNLVVNQGLDILAGLIGGFGGADPIEDIGFGVSAATPNPGNLNLTNEFTKAVAAITYPSTGVVNFHWTLEVGEYNGNTIQEYGLFTGAGKLVSRILDTPIVKNAGIRLEGDWSLTFANI